MIIAGSIAIGQLSTGIVPATGTRERLLPGVFDDSLKRNRITATINHDHARPIGFTLDGSLTVRTTATALHAELLVDDGDENHRQLVEAVHAGQCVGMSFLMSRVDAQLIEGIREISRATLKHIAFLIDRPSAYPSRVRLYP